MSHLCRLGSVGAAALLLAGSWSCGSDDEESSWPYGATGGTAGVGGSVGGTGGTADGGSGGTADGGSGGTADGGSGGTANGGSGGTADGGSGGTADGGSGGTADGGSGGTASGGSGGGSQPSCDTVQHAGEATYYDFADGGGNCSFDPTPNDLMVGAMNHTDYAASAVCGTCAHLVGPQGEVTVRIVDQCPECAVGDIDLSPEAFALIADLPLGRVDIQWQYVPCDVQGPLVYHFKDGSNQWWTAVQIRNHRHQIATVEYLDGGTYKSVPRVDYNYFVEASGMGPGPYSFRVTDIYGGTVEDTGIVFVENGDVPGAGQLPPCP